MNFSLEPHQLDLSGMWTFAYTPTFHTDTTPSLLPASLPICEMPVPGFWDDHMKALEQSGIGDALQFNPDHELIQWPMTGELPDASLPNIVGLGQYTRDIDLPTNGRVTFECSPTFIEAWLWVNGQCVAHQPHYSTAWSVSLDQYVKRGETNRIALQVANVKPRMKGCITRGFKGYSAGIAGPVQLRITGSARLADCYVHVNQSVVGASSLNWQVDVDSPDTTNQPMSLAWQIIDPDTQAVVREGTEDVARGMNRWQSDAVGLTVWSDQSPKRYRIKLRLSVGETLSDTHEQMFGLRTIKADGFNLLLNDKPVYLRGVTEHAYFPETCTMPLDKASYRQIIATFKSLGFNWLRFHTWVPPKPYLEAADELGMLIQVEAPRGGDTQQWIDILRACRKHPSVVIYCAGNEELLDEAKMDLLEQWSTLRKEYVPDALFSPQEALRGVEYGWSNKDLGDDAVAEPYLHNPRRLERLKTFSDCFGQYAWGMHSYNSVACDPQLIDDRLKIYQRPCLSHELGIHGSYLNLDLEHRYTNTRIGTEMYASVRRHLREHGLENRAATYYANSCAWMRRLRKHAVESARRSENVAGYDMLGGIDYHWHRIGYPCGVMNEFYELKPGETEKDVRQYNNTSVLLLDQDNHGVVTAGQAWSGKVLVSLYEETSLNNACVHWYVCDAQGKAYANGTIQAASIHNGKINMLGDIAFTLPNDDKPMTLTLKVRFTSDTLHLENDWPLWVYPAVSKLNHPVQFSNKLQKQWQSSLHLESPASDTLRVVDVLREEDVQVLEQGGRVLLLGCQPFPAKVTVDQIACAGRAEGNLATCIEDHPITRKLPHAGYCDWDFHTMIGQGMAVLMDELDVVFKPIIEVVSSFKNVQKQAALFELNVGAGRLLVCSLGMLPSDPAARYLLQACVDYVCSDVFKPEVTLSPNVLRTLIAQAPVAQTLAETDQGFDERAALTTC